MGVFYSQKPFLNMNEQDGSLLDILNFIYFLLWPRWPLSCILMFPKLAKQAEQNWHLWGFSPVWTFLWSSMRCFEAKPLPQVSHLYFNFSLGVWADSICCLMLLTIFPHFEHGTFSCTFFMCWLKFLLQPNSFPHWGQICFSGKWTSSKCVFKWEERACSDSIYLFLLRQKDVNLLRLKKVILLKNTNDLNLVRPTFLK